MLIEQLKSSAYEAFFWEAVPVTLTHPAGLEEVALLATNLGPSARILTAYEGTAADVTAIAAAVTEAFRPYVLAEGGVGLPARLNVFEAAKA